MTERIDVVVPNIVEFNLRQLGATLDPYTAASFMTVGAALADESVFWSTGPRVQVLHPGTDRVWFADVHEALELEPPPVVEPVGRGLLIDDLLGDGAALRALREQVDGYAEVQLLSWGATPGLYRLAAALRSWGAEVMLDVSPEPLYWTSLYLESKISCLDLARRLPGFRVPTAFTTMTWEETRGAVDHLLARGPAAIVKTLNGVGGTGAAVVRAGEEAAFWRELAGEPYFRAFPLIVQEFLEHADRMGCPAADLLVTETGVEEVVTSVMTVDGHRFRSVKVGASILPPEVDAQTLIVGRVVGEEAARLGFRGWIGVDCLVSADGRYYVTEINARRTGGMHPIVLARRWGIDRTVVRCDSMHPVEDGRRYDDLRPVLRSMWRSGERILPTTVRCLSRRRPSVGVLTAGATPDESDAVAAEFATRIVG